MEDIHAKQEYLRTKIPELHNQERFISFIRGLRQDGDDINNWSMIELKTIVARFRSELREEEKLKSNPEKFQKQVPNFQLKSQKSNIEDDYVEEQKQKLMQESGYENMTALEKAQRIYDEANKFQPEEKQLEKIDVEQEALDRLIQSTVIPPKEMPPLPQQKQQPQKIGLAAKIQQAGQKILPDQNQQQQIPVQRLSQHPDHEFNMNDSMYIDLNMPAELQQSMFYNNQKRGSSFRPVTNVQDVQNNPKIVQQQQQQKYEPCKPSFKEDMKCKQLQFNKLGKTTEPINIQVCKCEKVNKQLFGLSDTFYEIQTSPFNWKTQRSMGDFNWLRETLIKLCPGHLIPYLISSGDNTQDEKASKNRSYLNNFLQDIINNDEFKNRDVLFAFLSINSLDQFREYKKHANNIIKNYQQLNQLSNIQGNLHMEISNDIDVFCGNLSVYSDIQNGLYNVVDRQMHELKQLYKDITRIQKNIAGTFLKMFQNTETFNSKIIFQENKIDAMQNCYIQLHNVFIKQSQMSDEFKNVIENDYKRFFKYHKENINSLNEQLAFRATFKKEYDVKTDKNKGFFDHIVGLPGQIGNIFGANNTIDTPSNDEKILTQQFGYYSVLTLQNSQFFFQQKQQNYLRHFIEHSNNMSIFASKMHSQWSNDTLMLNDLIMGQLKLSSNDLIINE